MIPFIVEAGLNTSYIDSLFVSMFFKPSYIQNILINENVDLDVLHLQDIIFHYFVKNLRNRYCINFEMINEIRNNLIYQGWKQNDNIVDLYEVQELYDYLISKFCDSPILNFVDNNDITSMNFITININQNDNLNNLLDEWISTTFKKFSFKEIPKFLPIYLDRGKDGFNIMVDLHQAIYFDKYNSDESQHETIWIIHSIICYSNTGNGHYYSIIFDNNEWYLFSNGKLPSLIKINIKDEDMATRIKQECVFVFYTLDKKLVSN